VKNSVSVQTQLAEGLPLIQGDRVQLQQVILNLIINAVEAMSAVSEGSRELLIGAERDASGGVLVAVRDSGPRLNPESFERLSARPARRQGQASEGRGALHAHSVGKSEREQNVHGAQRMTGTPAEVRRSCCFAR